MKRESKGQRVKTFKAFIPQSDLTTVETQVVVYFKAQTGLFYIFDGSHMYATARDHISRTRREIVHDTMLTDNTLDGVMGLFESVRLAYTEAMKNSLKKRVIRFTFKRNTPWDGVHQPADDISFCGTPAIYLNYECLWQIGDQVFEQREDGARLEYRGKADEGRFRNGDAITIDWTEEREAFFANMKASLITLIRRVDDFQKDLVNNVDRAIAANAALALPAPEPKETEDASEA